MKPAKTDSSYGLLIAELSGLLEDARRSAARAVNTVMTATYWELGRRIVEFEQKGSRRAAYGEEVLARIAADLTARFGRGFSVRNLRSFRSFYLGWPIRQSVSAESNKAIPAKRQTPSAELASMSRFPLPWSHYVRLMSVTDEHARSFYETEALRSGWSFRQLDRQIRNSKNETEALALALC